MKTQFIYLCECRYKHPNHSHGISFATLCFKTEKEAQGYCEYHSNDQEFWSYSKVEISKFYRKKYRDRETKKK